MTREKDKLPRMTDEALRQFVDDLCSGRVFTSLDAEHRGARLHLVFMPLALGALETWGKKSLKDVGLIWEHIGQAMPWGVNGCPMFTSCRLMHREDWARARLAAKAEWERRQRIELPDPHQDPHHAPATSPSLPRRAKRQLPIKTGKRRSK